MDHPSDASSQVVMNLHVQISLGLASTLLDKWHIWKAWTYFEQDTQNPTCIQQWKNCKIIFTAPTAKIWKKNKCPSNCTTFNYHVKLGNQPSRKKCASILKYFLYNIWIHIFSIRMGRRVGWFFLAEHIFEDANSWLLFRKWHGGIIFFCYYINDNTSGIIPQSFWLHSCLQKVSNV